MAVSILQYIDWAYEVALAQWSARLLHDREMVGSVHACD